MSFTKYVRTPYKYLLYVPEDKEEIVKKFVSLAGETEIKAPTRIINFIEQELESLETNQPKTKLICEFCNKEFKNGSLSRFASGQKLLSCDACFKIRFEKGLVRSILKEFKEEEELFNPNLHGAKGLEKV